MYPLQALGQAWGTRLGRQGCHRTPGPWPRASAAASAAAMPSRAAATACRMLITGTMRQRKSGRSGTMSGPEGLSQARRDGGRIRRSQGPAWKRLHGGMERGGEPRAPGRSWGAASAVLPPLREPLSLWAGPGKTGNYSKPITPRRDLPVSPGQKSKHHTAGVSTEWLLG